MQCNALGAGRTFGRFALVVLMAATMAGCADPMQVAVTTMPAAVTIDLPDAVGGMAIDPLHQRIYLASCDRSATATLNHGSLVVVDEVNFNVIAQVKIDMDTFPGAVAVDPVADRVYVFGSHPLSGDYIFTFTGSTGKMIDTIPIPFNVNFLKVDKVTHLVHLGCTLVLDPATGMLTASLDTEPCVGEAIDEGRRRVYCATAGPDRRVKAFHADTFAPLREVVFGTSLYGIGIDPTVNRIFVGAASGGQRSITMLDGEGLAVGDKIKLLFDTSSAPLPPVIDGRRHRAYQASRGIIMVMDSAITHIDAAWLLNSSDPAPFLIDVDDVMGRVYYVTGSSCEYVQSSDPRGHLTYIQDTAPGVSTTGMSEGMLR